MASSYALCRASDGGVRELLWQTSGVMYLVHIEVAVYRPWRVNLRAVYVWVVSEA